MLPFFPFSFFQSLVCICAPPLVAVVVGACFRHYTARSLARRTQHADQNPTHDLLLQQPARKQSEQAAELCCSWASWQHLPLVCTNKTCVHFAEALSRISSKCCPESQCLWNPEHKHTKSCLFREREREVE